ncbi:MAG: CBS domain-containing protein [Candidatus Hydrothermarchaeales archaeon]
MKVKDIMNKGVIYAEVPGTGEEALNLIIQHDISGLPVVKKNTKKLAGIVTRSDFTRKPDENQLALLMAKDVITTTPDADIKEIAKIFSVAGFKRLPVVVDEKLVGIITTEDVVWKMISKMNSKEKVVKYMVKRFPCIWKDTPLKVATEIMRLSGSRALPVLDSDAKLYGMIADSDFLKVVKLEESTKKSEMSGGTEGDVWGWDSKNIIYVTTRKLEIPDIKVSEIVPEKVVSATKNTSVSELAKKMDKHRIEQVPVIDAEGKTIGLVRDIDLLRVLL